MKTRLTLSQEIIENPGFWRKTDAYFYYSGHCNRNSPFETSDSCANCDGARCDYCRKIEVAATYEFVPYSDVVYNGLVKQGINKEIASEIAYSDRPCKTHYLYIPDEIPEKTKMMIETPDASVWVWCEQNRDLDLYDMRDEYRKIMQSKGISWADGLDFYLNQINFWYKTNK